MFFPNTKRHLFHRTKWNPRKKIVLKRMEKYNDGVIHQKGLYKHPAHLNPNMTFVNNRFINNQYFIFCLFTDYADADHMLSYGQNCYLVDNGKLAALLQYLYKRTVGIFDVIYTDSPNAYKLHEFNTKTGEYSTILNEFAYMYKPIEYAKEAETRIILPIHENDPEELEITHTNLKKCFYKLV